MFVLILACPFARAVGQLAITTKCSKHDSQIEFAPLSNKQLSS